MKIAFLIPTTSNKRDEWKNIKDSYLYKILINSFITKQDKEHTYNFYIGYDKDDRIFSNKKERDIIIDKVSKIFTNFKFIFYEFKNIKKGHVTKMWNELCKEAYNDNCDYYFQIGDDIKFHTKGFINDSIKILQKNNNVGMTGPINNNNQILTQCFVSKKHIEILGYFFPEEIINWCCDDWYNYLYKPNNFFPLKNHYASNDGGEPRYIVNDDKNFMNINNVRENVTKLREYSLELANRDRKKIEKYIEKGNYLTEDGITKWGGENNALLLTRTSKNIETFDFNTNKNIIVILTGYDNIIKYFFNNIIKKVKSKILLILIESDIINITKEYLDSDKILHCYTWNKMFEHHKLSCLPIGLNHTRHLVSIKNNTSKNINKKLVCFNCSLNTNSERILIKNTIEKNLNCDKLNYIEPIKTIIINSYTDGKIKVPITNTKCYEDMSKYKFIISPKGAGIDCHRTWESIILGCIPIVKSSSINEIYKDLPILVIDDWSELNVELLEKKYKEINKTKYNYEKLYLNYWTNKFEELLSSKEQHIHFITYGDEKYEKSKKRLINEANNFDEFKTVMSYGKNDLTQEFKNKYKNILDMKRGGGYWLWKLDIIKQTFSKIKENDIILYLDAGCQLNDSGKKRFGEYIELLNNSKYGMLSFKMENQLEKFWTTTQILKYFNVEDNKNILNDGQYMSTVLLLKKNNHSREYLKIFEQCIMDDSLLITDKYNQTNQKEYFKDNRHDQSISSIIRKKIGSVVIGKDESWIVPFGSSESLKYPFWATRIRK